MAAIVKASEVKAEEGVATTDLSLPYRKAFKHYVVKVEREIRPGHSRITTKKGDVMMIVDTSRVDTRMRRGARVAFFQARVETNTHILELCDPIEVSEDKRW